MNAMVCPDCCQRSIALIFFIFHCANTATDANWTSILSPTVEPDSMNRDTRDGERGGAVVLSPVVINPYFDSSENLKREYRLEDFLWAGSGDGPMPSDQDGGLAWEDNLPIIGGGDGTDLVIKVTKTMVLFKTVLTTIVPVEITPTVVLSPISPTPRLITGPELTSSSIFPSEHFGFSDHIWPTPTSGIWVTPTVSLSPHFPPDEEEDISDNTLKAAAAERMYWVQTIIKANSSIITSIPSFQGMMQKNLARVYASAFKRHLMSSLGILGVNHTKQQQQSSSISSSSNNNNNNNNYNSNIPNTIQSSTSAPAPDPAPTSVQISSAIPISNPNQNISEDNSNDITNDTSDIRKRRKKRRKRSSSSTNVEREELDAGWLYLGRHLSPSKMRALATTAMNVTVSILNISETDKSSQISLNYIVCAEGNPIPAASAVQDLELVTKLEMEKEIGYEVINKAEALVASPLQETKLEVATSPWLIVAIISIVVMACLVLVIMYMVWKWKNNRLGDTIISPTRTTRPISGSIEGGVINPAFSSQTGLGPPSPIERSEVPTLPRSQRSRQSQIQIHTATGHHFIKSSATSITSTNTNTNTSHHKSVDEKSRHLIISQQQPAPSAATVKSQQQALASELNILLSEKQHQAHTKTSEKISPSSIKSQTRSENRSLSISSKSSYDEIENGQKRTRKHRHKERDKENENGKDKDKVSSPDDDDNDSKVSRRKTKEKQIPTAPTAKARQSPSSSRIRTGLTIHKTRSRTPSPRKKPRKRLDSASSVSGSVSLSSQKEAVRRRKTQVVGSAVEEEEVEEEDEILEIQEKLATDKERKESSRSVGEYKSTSVSSSKSKSKSQSKSKSKSKSDEAGKLSSSHFPGRLTVPNLDEHLEGATSRSIDKISYGNLDVCQEAIARPISAKAKKLLPSKSLQSAGSGAGAGVAADGTSISSSILMEQQEYSQEHLNWRAQLRGKDKTQYKNIDESSEDGKKSLYEQDRDMSDSYEPIDSTEVEPPTHKDAQVQTPTRRGKGTSKFRKQPQPKQSSESLISTESEEIIEVHHLDSSSGDGNPMGKMRKRFHQFLDDAFNIMGKKEDEELGRSKSAKVSISHHIETRERKLPRPWTSQQQPENEQAISRLRPKSASFGPPKRAWGTGSERRCQSAKSNASTGSFRGRLWSGASGGNSAATIFERGDDSSEQEQDVYDHESTVVSEPIPIHTSHLPADAQGRRPYASFTEPIFPNYPIYPDIPIQASSSSRIPITPALTTSTGAQKQQEKPSDPAVPLILAIKEEIKRFERVKIAEIPPNLNPPSNN